MSSTKQPAFRLLHETGPGQQLLQLATLANQQMSAARDAQSSLIQCRDFFETICDQEPCQKFLESGIDDASGGFEDWMARFDNKSSILLQLLQGKAENSQGEHATNATPNFFQVCAKCLQPMQKHLEKRLEDFLSMLTNDNVIDVTSELWASMCDGNSIFLQVQIAKFCQGNGAIASLLQHLKPTMPDEMTSSLTVCPNLLQLVLWQRVGFGMTMGHTFWPKTQSKNPYLVA